MNKHHCIQDTIGEWPAGHRRNRKVIPFRLCIGPTHITHSHLIKREEPTPILYCVVCMLPSNILRLKNYCHWNMSVIIQNKYDNKIIQDIIIKA